MVEEKKNRQDLEKLNEELQRFLENYDLCASYILDGDNRTYLGEKENRTCRFCGLSKKDGAKFKKDAHALSNLISNTTLFSCYECDECNQKFSEYESDFAAYMKLYHCILQVRGKNGIPSYRLRQSRIDAEDKHITVNLFEGDPSLTAEINEERKCVTLKGFRTYTPLYVYKALLKMALTIVLEEDFQNLQNALAFLNKKNVTVKSKLPIWVTLFGNGANVYKHVAAIVCRRKDTSTEPVPSYWFVLAYNNFCFQMPIFGSILDEKLEGQTINFHVLPTPPQLIGYPIISRGILDFSSNVKVKNEPVLLTLGFEAMKSTDLNTDIVE